MNKLKVYVGCSLNGASSNFMQEVDELKKKLQETYEVLDFVGLSEISPVEVVKHDLACVKACDFMVGICDLPSLGLGIEIGTANALSKPILLLAKNKTISKMVRGNHIENSKSIFKTYTNTEEILTLVKEFTLTV